MLKSAFDIAELRRRSISGAVITVSAQGVRLFLILGTTVILARLLLPGDFGLVTMVSAVIGFVNILKNMGLSVATIQADELTSEQASTLFWINLMLGVLAAGAICALASSVSSLYAESRLFDITIALSSSFVFTSVGLQHKALLSRQLRFTALSTIDVSSQIAGALVAIVAAFKGAGYWAIVLNILVTSASSSIFMWIASGWSPGRPVFGSGVRRYLGFGANFTGYHLLAYLVRNFDNMLIGTFCGAGALGLYSKAYGLLLMPVSQINDPLNSVAIPSLSRLQHDPDQFSRYYCRVISLAVTITMPLLAFAFLVTDELVVFVLGNNWTGVTPLFRALAPAAFAASLNIAIDLVLLPLGRSKRQFRIALWSTPMIILSFYLGLPYGALGVATGCSVIMLLLLIPQILYALHDSPVRPAVFFGAIWRSVLSSCSTLLLLWFIKPELPDSMLWISRLAVMFIYFLLGYFLTYWALPGGRDFLKKNIRILLDQRSMYEKTPGN